MEELCLTLQFPKNKGKLPFTCSNVAHTYGCIVWTVLKEIPGFDMEEFERKYIENYDLKKEV